MSTNIYAHFDFHVVSHLVRIPAERKGIVYDSTSKTEHLNNRPRVLNFNDLALTRIQLMYEDADKSDQVLCGCHNHLTLRYSHP